MSKEVRKYSQHSSHRRGVWRIAASIAVLAIVVALVPSAFAEGLPTITSDKLDYPAGAPVTLTGANWAAGETVHIVVNDTVGQTWKHEADVIGAADGSIVDVFSLPTYFVSDYDVTASGPTSGTATATFTDAPPQIDLDQCRNGAPTSPNNCEDLGGSSGWVNGNVGAQQAHMLEGYSTPFRAVVTSVPTGTPITVVIGYDIRHSSRNAYDYLTQYQRLEPHSFFGHAAETVDPIDGVSGVSGTVDTYPIPAPSSAGSPVSGQPTTSFNSLPTAERVMTLFGGDITGMAYVSQGSLTAAQSQTQISVTFTPDSSNAVLAWGGHIAQCSVWGTTNGTCNSAGGIDGSPYHMALISWTAGNVGQQDRSMAAAVVVQPGNLTLAKSLTGGPQGYTGPFTIHYDCGTGYVGDVQVSASSSQTVNGIPSGSVCTISETPPSPPGGYTFGTPTFSPSNTVTIGEGTTVTVTTNNTLTHDKGYLKITKSFDAKESGFNGTFAIKYNCGAGDVTVNVAAGASTTVGPFDSGTQCTVSEPTLPTAPTGWTFGTPSISPTQPVAITAGNQAAAVEVTVTNSITRDTGSLEIKKTLSNPDGANVPASFTVKYDCGTGYTGQVSVAPGSPATVNGIPTGNTCTVEEVAPAAIPGFTWGTITYTPASVTIDTKGQSFSITVGNSITRDRGSLTIVKKVVNDNGGTATVNAFGINTTAGSLTFDGGVANGTTTTYTTQKITVVTETYTLKENNVYGYTEGNWSCTGAAGTVVPNFDNGSVQVGKGEDVVCTITNDDEPGKIIIIKNAKPAQGSFAFTTTGTGYNGFTLTGATTGGGNQNSQTLNAGTYTVKEGTQLGWILTGVGGSKDPLTPYDCVVSGTGGSSGTAELDINNELTGKATIVLKNGDTVTCTFENTGVGATRTQGFWATHPQLAEIAWFGGSAFNHTFPGVAATDGIGDRLICGRPIDDLGKLMGGFWSDVSKTSTGGKRSALDQARMQLLQQLLAAELNASAFGSVPSGGSGKFAEWEAALCGTNQTAIKNAQQGAASFNSQGDNSTFTPGTSADSKFARSIANIPFWNIIKP